MFERGFKSWCETIAIQQRKELGLQPVDPLDSRRLAESLEVIVWDAHEVPLLDSQTLNVLTKDDPDSWSAVTLRDGGKDLVILNPTHSRGRASSNLMHELSHILIGHDAVRVDITPDNLLMLSTYDKKQEGEADWLAGCLLLPRPALMHIRNSRMDPTVVRKVYGVSDDMFDYRMKMTGVDRQFSRARTYK